MARIRTTPAAIVQAERRHRALLLRRQGMSYAEIAPKLGVSEATVHSDIMAALDRMEAELPEACEKVRQLELSRLDRLLQSVWKLAERGSAIHVQTALRIQERRAKLLGLDQPVRVSIPDVIGVRIYEGVEVKDV